MDIVKGKYYKYNHPNGFVLKALSDSTSDNFRAVVVLKGNFNYEVGHEDRLWSVSCFVETEFQEEIDESAKKGRLLGYALKNYPIGTLYKYHGNIYEVNKNTSHIKGESYIHWQVYNHYSNEWAKIIKEVVKEETIMETQKLSRQGLKEIYEIACWTWKVQLEKWGIRNPFENYVDLTQEEVNEMFSACTKDQLPIVSKYLKKYDDGSVDLTKYKTDDKGFYCGSLYILRDRENGQYKDKSFFLSDVYNWEIKKDEFDKLCLIPTKRNKEINK